MTNRSTYLFARPNWLEGAARVLDLGGTVSNYNYAPSSVVADAIAMHLDWACVGDDLRAALRQYLDDLDDETVQGIYAAVAKSMHAGAK